MTVIGDGKLWSTLIGVKRAMNLLKSKSQGNDKYMRAYEYDKELFNSFMEDYLKKDKESA